MSSTEERIMKWIPVTERLPEFNELVLVYCRIYGRFLAAYEQLDESAFGNWRDTDGNLGILPPTHWMELPNPPSMT